MRIVLRRVVSQWPNGVPQIQEIRKKRCENKYSEIGILNIYNLRFYHQIYTP